MNTYAKRLTDEGVLNESDIASIQQAMYNEVEEALQFAQDSPYPEPESALEHVFAERTVSI
jgi:acetoin:2,6-dichlorophenolindophenol oxidoreductase subunit alpha